VPQTGALPLSYTRRIYSYQLLDHPEMPQIHATDFRGDEISNLAANRESNPGDAFRARAQLQAKPAFQSECQ
jgi:hypothetical protein